MQHTGQPGSSESPRENLYLSWTRQCDALLKSKEALLGLCDDLPTYEETMKGETIKTKMEYETVAFENLPQMKENALKGLDGAIAALEKIEVEAGISLRTQKERLASVRKRLTAIDISEIPSSSEIDSALRNEFADFVNMQEGTRQAELLRHQTKETGPTSWQTFTLDHGEFVKAQGLIHSHSREIFEPAKAVETLSGVLIAFRNRAREKQKAQMGPKVATMKKIYVAAARADKLPDGARDKNLGIAQPLGTLERLIKGIEAGHVDDFWVASRYRDYMQEPLSKAYEYVGKYGFEEQLRREEQARNNPAVTEIQTKVAGAAPQRRGWLKRVFGGK